MDWKYVSTAQHTETATLHKLIHNKTPMTKLPTITKKQESIISLIFRFRFLDRIQIQKILKHKDYKTINDWLKDLTEKEYTCRIYDPRHAGNTKPAIYFIAKNGIAYIKFQNGGDAKIVQKLYREKTRSKSFIEACQLLADIYLDLTNRANDQASFEISVRSDFSAHAMGDLLSEISPHAFIEQRANNQTKQYFLETFINQPAELLRMRIKKYISYYQASEWEAETHMPFPTILFVCPDEKIFAYVRRYTKTKIAMLDEPDLNIQITENDKVKEFGITGDIWKQIN
jgi:hypothetical protein